MRLLADCLIGRSTKSEEVSMSFAIWGSEVTTAGVEPKLKVISCLASAPIEEAKEASDR